MPRPTGFSGVQIGFWKGLFLASVLLCGLLLFIDATTDREYEFQTAPPIAEFFVSVNGSDSNQGVSHWNAEVQLLSIAFLL